MIKLQATDEPEEEGSDEETPGEETPSGDEGKAEG